MVYVYLKKRFQKEESNKITYGNYKQFHWETFKNEEYESYEQNFIKMLNTHVLKKVTIFRGNNKPYNKNLRKAIIKRSRLKNRANRSKDPVDIANYKIQCNFVV